MYLKMHQGVVYLFFVLCFTTGINCQGTYKAAVVEFAPKDETPQSLSRILKNVASYQYYMELAADKNAQIIVFPEYGLTSWEDIDYNIINDLSTEVPDPTLEISPCRTPNPTYSEYFIHLSCAAATNKIYAVINLIEKQHNKYNNETFYHNTNVVFDDFGVVIARYRKINLFNEPLFVPGNELVTFKTRFGVTFGMFICFDFIFKKPALDMLANATITDVISSTAWFSQLPFYGSLSIQHGYAKSNGVNLLVASMNKPSKKNGGSGIYLYNGDIAQTYISGVEGTKILIQDVPKALPDSPRDSCQIPNAALERGISIPGFPGGQLPDSTAFVTSQENLVNYTFKSLNVSQSVISETICSGSSDFCCIFDLQVTRNTSVSLNYVYKLIAYYGVSKTSSHQSLGLRNCALVACTTDINTSCGSRHKEVPQGLIFESISVKISFDPRTTHTQPATINHKLLPITDYTYCKREVNGSKVDVEMKTTGRQNDLLTFGVHGRVYIYDGQPGGPINSASLVIRNMYITIMISILIFLLQD